MNEFKYQITQIIFLVLLGLGAYWAFTHLDNGVTYTRDEIVTVDVDSIVPDETIDVIDADNVTPSSDTTIDDSQEKPVVTTTPINNTTTDTSSQKNNDLIADLQKIADTKIIMAKGSSGQNVGVVQKFLDVYFDDRNVVADKDFGSGTASLVKEFQTKELNGGDGRVGPNTLKAMIAWLENN